MLSLKKNAGQHATTSNFHARAARSRHIHNKFKNSFQGDGMDKSNKHCKEGGFLS